MNILKFHKKSGLTADSGLVCAKAHRRLGGGVMIVAPDYGFAA